MFEGHEPKNPCVSFHMSEAPAPSALAFTAWDSAQKRVNTSFTSPPLPIEMIRQWSSSLHHASAVLLSLWKMPRLSGQKRAAPALVSKLVVFGFWKRKPCD